MSKIGYPSWLLQRVPFTGQLGHKLKQGAAAATALTFVATVVPGGAVEAALVATDTGQVLLDHFRSRPVIFELFQVRVNEASL